MPDRQIGEVTGVDPHEVMASVIGLLRAAANELERAEAGGGAGE